MQFQAKEECRNERHQLAQLFLLLFAIVACASAVAVVVTGNIVRMACWLVVSLGAVAGLFFLAGADFLGAVQLMVYVGGTMVLLVFGVMLTARGPFVSMKTGGGQWIMATIIGGSLLAVLLQAALSIPDWATPTAGLAETTLGPHRHAAGSGADGHPHRPVRSARSACCRGGMSGHCWRSRSFPSIWSWCWSGRRTWPGPNGGSERSRASVSRRRTPDPSLNPASRTLPTMMNLFTEPIGLSHYLVVGAILFVCGVVCMATKRNVLGVLMGIELVLNGANLNFVAFGSPLLACRRRRTRWGSTAK